MKFLKIQIIFLMFCTSAFAAQLKVKDLNNSINRHLIRVLQVVQDEHTEAAGDYYLHKSLLLSAEGFTTDQDLAESIARYVKRKEKQENGITVSLNEDGVFTREFFLSAFAEELVSE